MKKTVFIVPTYSSHFQKSYELEKSFLDYDVNADLLFVLTNQHEYEIFNLKNSQKMFLEENFAKGVDSRGIITIKKLKGVEFASQEGYEYAIVMDCESTFTKKYDAYQAAKYLSDRKKIYSTTTNHHILIEINTRGADFFNEEDKNKLKILTKNFTEFFWFNDIAFYDLSNTKKFFETVYGEDKLNNFYSKMSSAHFDHIIYVYYCLLYENYQLINLNEKISLPIDPFSHFHLSALESIGDRSTRDRVTDENAKKLLQEINPFWLPYGTKLTTDNSFILFHQDRA